MNYVGYVDFGLSRTQQTYSFGTITEEYVSIVARDSAYNAITVL